MDDYRRRRRWLRQNDQEPDRDAVRAWLAICLEGLRFERADELTYMWTRLQPTPGSDWTREAELDRWIAAAEEDPVAWAGCRRLLIELGNDDVPPALGRWAFDVARKRIEEPKRPHGQHATDHTWRNARIFQAVAACRSAGLTLDEACQEVAEIPGTPASEQVRDIYKEVRKTGSIFDGIETVIGPLPPQGA